MIRTYQLPCHLVRKVADRLNAESGRIYSRVLVEHYRIYRQTGHWLSVWAAEKLDDSYHAQEARLLHAHSIDAAQEAFYKACKTARANCRDGARFPYKRQYYRPTIWKNTGVRRSGDTLLLSLAHGQEPLRVRLPSSFPVGEIKGIRLVYNQAGCRYDWHIVVENGQLPPQATGTTAAALDLGEVHPAAVTDGQEAVVMSARALRSIRQNTHKRLASLQQAQSYKTKGSRQWRKLQRRKARFLAQQKRRTRDIEHKVSRAVADWAIEHQVGILAIGDVRNVANGKRLAAKSQQKIGSWGHGQLRQYITYKAEAAGITVQLVDETYSSQTCPVCGQRHKPAGRVFYCPACGFRGHRDGQVGAVNLLSRFICGQVAQVRPPSTIKYRHPFGKLSFRTGKRSRPDTGPPLTAWVACAGESA